MSAPALAAPKAAADGWKRGIPSLLPTAVWLILFLNVQPWSQSESGTTGALKGAVLLAVALLVLLALPPRAAFVLPWPLALWVVYAGYLSCSALLQDDFADPAMRAGRIAVGVLIPALIWGFIRCREGTLEAAACFTFAVLAFLIILGAIVEPGSTWLNGREFSSGGRLMGALLPMMPPRVGEVGAVLAGLALVQWSLGRISIWVLAPVLSLGIALIMLSRTRTAALALVLGLLLAFAATLRHRAGQKGFLFLAGTAVALLPAWGAVSQWGLRGQSPELFARLSGRTAVWDFIANAEVDTRTFLFGHGLGEKRILLRRGEGDFQAVPIDNSWLDAYWETGVIGLVLVGAALSGALVYALRAKGTAARATSLFLLGYVCVASVNESGLCDFSSLTLLVILSIFICAVDRNIPGGQGARDPAVPLNAIPSRRPHRAGFVLHEHYKGSL